jgi:hypothetical protein
MLFHMHDEVELREEQNQKCFKEMMSFVDELKSGNSLIFDSQVLPKPDAVQFPGTSGLELQALPKLGGFFVIDVSTHEAAMELAERCPHRQVGVVSIYPLNATLENAYVGT